MPTKPFTSLAVGLGRAAGEDWSRQVVEIPHDHHDHHVECGYDVIFFPVIFCVVF
jgi:hypothetical protein